MDYAAAFSKLLHSLRQGQYDLVLYINPSVAHKLAINATSQITLIPFSQVRQSIYSRYLDQERKVMATSKYKSLIPKSQSGKPEFSRAEFTMVQHDKVALLNDAAERSPGYSHLAWIDFGAIRSQWYAPSNIDLCKLPSHKALASSADTIIDEFEPVSPFDMFNQPKTISPETGTYTSRFPKDAICGTTLFLPRELVPRIRNLYEAELRRWQALGVAHNEQAMFLQLHKASNGSLFHLWSPPTCVKGGLRCRTLSVLFEP